MKQETCGQTIACTLDTGEHRERMGWIAGLNRSALQSARREGVHLILTYTGESREDIREMIRREQECCPFLRFELDEHEKGLTLAISAPGVGEDALDGLFAPFLTGSGAGDRCACSAKAAPAAPPRKRDRGMTLATSAAGTAAAGALACAACCILPLALPAAVLAVAGGALAWLAGIHEEVIAVAVALVAVGWIWVAWQSWRTAKRPATATVLVMLAATVMLGLAMSWPAIEPVAVTAIASG